MAIFSNSKDDRLLALEISVGILETKFQALAKLQTEGLLELFEGQERKIDALNQVVDSLADRVKLLEKGLGANENRVLELYELLSELGKTVELILAEKLKE